MIDRLTFDGTCVYVHITEISLKGTKAFTHGRLAFDVEARVAIFKDFPPVALPEGLTLTEGASVAFQLVGPDGALRKQTRLGVLRANDKQPGILRIAGMSKTPARFPAADGWKIEVFKYRAYFNHPGLVTDAVLPEWLKSSVARQRSFWNRLAWLCRDARRKCSDVSTETIVEFVNGTILPAIDEFNDSLGRARGKEKMKHPPKLKTEMPGLDHVWGFVGVLRKRIVQKSAVPDGLLEKVMAFAVQFKPDYTPLDTFISTLDSIADKESKDLELRHFEIRPTINSFKAALMRRKTLKLAWSDGWPIVKYSDRPRAADWGIYYYFNKAGVDSSLLETPKGIPGMAFGPSLPPDHTGHELLKCKKRSNRALREAELSIPGDNHEQWTYRFGVLQHQPLPPDSHLKQWSLIYSREKLWLCLTVERQRPVPALGMQAGGLDVGWRRTEAGILFGTLFEPESKTVRELTIDLQRSPVDQKDRTPFRIDMGPTRWDKRNINRLLSDWKPGDPIPNTVEVRRALGKHRSSYKDVAKVLLQKHLGDQLPVWFDKAGINGLLKLKEQFKEVPAAQEIINDLQRKTADLNVVAGMYLERYTRQLEYGQLQVAHDVCQHLQQRGVTRLIVEASFAARASQMQDNEDSDALKNSQKYRQFASVGKFVSVLKNTAVKYGISIGTHTARNTTRICQYCDYLNSSTEKVSFHCENCGMLVKQDQNAAVNLSRFGTDPELAEMALTAGRA